MRPGRYQHKDASLAVKNIRMNALDWSQGDAALGRLVGMTTPAVRYWRLKLGHPPKPRGGWNRLAVAVVLFWGMASALAQSTNIVITQTNQPITFIQPEGKSVVVSQRIGVTWKIWFAQGPLRLGTNYASQACCVRVTNPAVREVRVSIQ